MKTKLNTNLVGRLVRASYSGPGRETPNEIVGECVIAMADDNGYLLTLADIHNDLRLITLSSRHYVFCLKA